MENKQYYDTYYGKKISEYGLKYGYVDYACLSNAVGGSDPYCRDVFTDC